MRAFNCALTLEPEDVSIKDPAGGAVPLRDVEPITGEETTFEVHFAEVQALAGTYRFAIGPHVEDLTGLEMAQDGDAVNGEPGDVHHGTFAVAPVPLALIPFAEGFEGGDVLSLGGHWSFWTEGIGTIYVESDSGLGGTGCLAMAHNSSAVSSEKAFLHLNLSGQHDLVLDFSARELAHLDGVITVSISHDGLTWHQIGSQGGWNPMYSWKQHSFDLDAEIATAGISYTSDFQIRFYHVRGSAGKRSVFVFDDIRVHIMAPLEVTAGVATGEEWVYQNTQTTTDDRHVSTATISLVSEASPGEAYNVSIADDGPGGANFALGPIIDNRPGEQTLTAPIIGGRVGASTPGTGGAAYSVTLTVEGQTSLEADTADVTLALRYIGDVDGSGAPGAQDKQFFNQRLNNVATAYPDRCYDLNGSGGAPNAEDKQVMNQVLNGVSLP